MGAKKLRAVAVRGHRRLAVHDEERVKDLARWFSRQKPHPLTAYGTPLNVAPLNALGILPTRNFREGVFEQATAIAAQRLKDTVIPGNESCWACSVRCKRTVSADPEYGFDQAYGGPEYETVAAFGSLCGISDAAAIVRANEICNANAMDTISTGVCVAFAMECFENGILSQKDADGLNLRFGNAEGMVALVGKIARREGLGDLLAEGVKRAAAVIGSEAEALAVHVKGLECPMHDPRGKYGLALSYAVASTGPDHMEAPHDHTLMSEGPALERVRTLGLASPLHPLSLRPDKVRSFAVTQQVWSLYNSLGMCVFVGFPAYPFTAQKITEVVNAVTGWETSFYELFKIGERATVMSRLFNLREGITSADDTLPDRLFEPLSSGPLAGKSISREELGAAVRVYYDIMGWDCDQGVPRYGKLVELGIESFGAHPG